MNIFEFIKLNYSNALMNDTEQNEIMKIMMSDCTDKDFNEFLYLANAVNSLGVHGKLIYNIKEVQYIIEVLLGYGN